MKRWALAAALVLLFVLSATVVFADHSWANYHWARTGNPFTLQLEDDLTTTEWKSYLGAVSADWTVSTVLDTATVDQATSKSCKAILGKTRVCNGKYGFNGWLGLAQIWVYADGHIAQARSRVNDTYFGTATYNNPNAKRHVLCQEVGHTLGLGHQTGVSCMNDRDGLFEPAYVSPDIHDYQQLETIYGSHLDSGSTVAVFAASSASSDAGDGQDFGVAIGKDANGRPNLFVKHLGKGEKLYTWVLWAD